MMHNIRRCHVCCCFSCCRIAAHFHVSHQFKSCIENACILTHVLVSNGIATVNLKLHATHSTISVFSIYGNEIYRFCERREHMYIIYQSMCHDLSGTFQMERVKYPSRMYHVNGMHSNVRISLNHIEWTGMWCSVKRAVILHLNLFCIRKKYRLNDASHEILFFRKRIGIFLLLNK